MKLRNRIYVSSTRVSHRVVHYVSMLKVNLKGWFSPKRKFWEPQYTTIGTLGNGGNACVVTVVDNKGNQFALKPLNKDYINREDKRQRFLREVNVMKDKLSDLLGVIPIIDFCEKGYWYVMPIAQKSMDIVKNMNLSQRIDAFLTIAETLKIIHSRKISHRDIKPANILYYNKYFCFCDFGLCHIENSKLTKKRDNIGAKFTIAPEMRRDSKRSDPYKADVYSMGKTLWMYLTENEDAFEGTYNPLDRGIGLHYFEQYREANIAEIEFLLEDATKNSPDDRPTINEFCDRLSYWITISNAPNYDAIQQGELKMLKHYLNPACEIDSFKITKAKDIVRALNYFRLTPVLNHMLYPHGGGLDFDSAEMANEEGCIALRSNIGTIDILKPKQFIFESFDDYKWFYFLLEADQLTPILTTKDVLSEELVEDIPGHYCDAIDFVYGVYDYDSGKKLPQCAKNVERFCRGTFLILPKFGYYNQQNSTYDGRQNNCTAEEFKAYIQKMKKLADEGEKKGYTFRQIAYALDVMPNPFSRSDNYDFLDNPKKASPNIDAFVLDMIRDFDISEELSKIRDKDSPATFTVYITSKTLKCPNTIVSYYEDQIQWFLGKDGKIHKTCWKDEQVLKLHDRSITNSLVEIIESAINDLYHKAGFENEGFQSTWCKMTMCRTGKPAHMFTKMEIKELMRNADDRLGNTLVIDEFGFAHVIPGHFDKHVYPVSQETWCSRNNYVGKYSNLSDLNESYVYMLEGWLYYLEKGVTIYIDYSPGDLNASELLKKIKMHYR